MTNILLQTRSSG